MIKCNVKICGTIATEAVERISNEGDKFISFMVDVALKGRENDTATARVSVATSDLKPRDIKQGNRIAMRGQLRIKGTPKKTYYDFSPINFDFDPRIEDCIEGDMDFRGAIGKEIKSRVNRSGKPYVAFAAYNSDKQEDGTYGYIWMQMVYYGEKEEWLVPKGKIDAKGTIKFGSFRSQPDIKGIVSEARIWEFKSKK